MPGLITLALWCVTAHCFGFMDVTLDIVIPSVLAATITANGAIPSLIVFFISYKMPLAWAICLMVSLGLFAGSIIFKGRAVAEELKRHFHV